MLVTISRYGPTHRHAAEKYIVTFAPQASMIPVQVTGEFGSTRILIYMSGVMMIRLDKSVSITLLQQQRLSDFCNDTMRES